MYMSCVDIIMIMILEISDKKMGGRSAHVNRNDGVVRKTVNAFIQNRTFKRRTQPISKSPMHDCVFFMFNRKLWNPYRHIPNTGINEIMELKPKLHPQPELQTEAELQIAITCHQII